MNKFFRITLWFTGMIGILYGITYICKELFSAETLIFFKTFFYLLLLFLIGEHIPYPVSLFVAEPYTRGAPLSLTWFVLIASVLYVVWDIKS